MSTISLIVVTITLLVGLMLSLATSLMNTGVLMPLFRKPLPQTTSAIPLATWVMVHPTGLVTEHGDILLLVMVLTQWDTVLVQWVGETVLSQVVSWIV